MNTYVLSVNLIKKASNENHPISIRVECEDDELEDYCIKLCTKGFIFNDDYGIRFIPANRIEDIDILYEDNK